MKTIISLIIIVFCSPGIWGQDTTVSLWPHVSEDIIEHRLLFEGDSIIENIFLLSNNQFRYRVEKIGCYYCSTIGRGNYFSKGDTLILVDTTYRSVTETKFIKTKQKYYGFKLNVDQKRNDIGIKIDEELFEKDSAGIIIIPKKHMKFIDGVCVLTLIDQESGKIIWMIYLDKEDYGIREYQVELLKKANYYRYVWDDTRLVELDSRDKSWNTRNRTFKLRSIQE